MSAQMVLLPVFVLVGLTFVLLLWMAGVRTRSLCAGGGKVRGVGGGAKWTGPATPNGK